MVRTEFITATVNFRILRLYRLCNLNILAPQYNRSSRRRSNTTMPSPLRRNSIHGATPTGQFLARNAHNLAHVYPPTSHPARTVTG